MSGFILGLLVLAGRRVASPPACGRGREPVPHIDGCPVPATVTLAGARGFPGSGGGEGKGGGGEGECGWVKGAKAGLDGPKTTGRSWSSAPGAGTRRCSWSPSSAPSAPRVPAAARARAAPGEAGTRGADGADEGDQEQRRVP